MFWLPVRDLYTKVKGRLFCLWLVVRKLFHIACLKWSNYEMKLIFRPRQSDSVWNGPHMETISSLH